MNFVSISPFSAEVFVDGTKVGTVVKYNRVGLYEIRDKEQKILAHETSRKDAYSAARKVLK